MEAFHLDFDSEGRHYTGMMRHGLVGHPGMLLAAEPWAGHQKATGAEPVAGGCVCVVGG